MAIDLSSFELDAIVVQFSPAPSTREDLVRYAQASGDSNPLHLDPDFARQAGFDNLVVHGMLGMAHMGRLLSDNFDAERIRSFGVRFEGVVTVGQKVSYVARFGESVPDGTTLVLEAVLENGTRVISGKALIAN